jgi:outer membrane PBP1 activator LpoA protein
MGWNGRAEGTVRPVTYGALMVLMLGFGLAACGSSGTKTSTGATTTTAASTVTTTTASGATAPHGGTNPGSTFCRGALALQAKTTQQTNSEPVDTPAQLQTLFKETLADLAGFVALAPSQIKGAAETLASVERQFYNDLQHSDFNFRKMAADPAAMSLIQSPSFQQATVTINNYLSRVCGIGNSPPPTT